MRHKRQAEGLVLSYVNKLRSLSQESRLNH